MGLASDPFPKVINPPLTCGSRECSLVAGGGISAHKSVQLTGNGANTENLFQVTDQVRVMQLYLVVTAVGDSTTFSNVKFETDDGTAQSNISAVVDCSGAVAGASVRKTGAFAAALVFLNAAAGGVAESAFNKANFEFDMVQKTGDVATYIRLSYTGDATTDVTVSAVCFYEPLYSTSKLEAV